MRRIVIVLPLLFLVATALAQTGGAQRVDHIVAVVDGAVITAREHRARLAVVEAQLNQQGTPLPSGDALEKQVLERMIDDQVQLQEAKEVGVRIDDQQLDQTLMRIAKGNGMNMAEFREAIERDGIRFSRFREDIRDEMTIGRLREREVDARIMVSESEIDAFLEAERGTGALSDEYELAHLLIRVPESAGPEVLGERKRRAEEAVRKLKSGEPFAQIAAGYSDAPDAMQGGVLGFRKLDRFPALYAEAAARLEVNELSDLLRSPNGFHVIKLLSKRGGGVLPPVSQTHVRHILVRVDEVVSEDDARFKLTTVRERLMNGEDFAEMAHRYSLDGSAAKGGDLGWVYPGDTVPDFERAMDALKIGEVSQPVQTPFGWHLIQVLERRVQDVSEERRRQTARSALRERRSAEAYQDWLRQLRDRAYIDRRLDQQ